MASPTPDTPPSLDPKSRDSASEESKPEVNGHVSPVESKPETEAPKLNGSGKAEEQPAANGVAHEDVKMENGDDGDESNREDDKVTSKSEDTESGVKTESKPKPEDNALVPASSGDVEMTDATTVNDATKSDEGKATEKPLEDKPAEEPSSQRSDEQEESKRDADMTDPPAQELPAITRVNGATGAPSSSAEDAALPGSEVDLGPASISQLAIESTEVDASAAKPSVEEVAMEDAPVATDAAQPGKVAREREEDVADEPAPKRAKTEPKEDEPSAPTPAPGPSSAPASAPPTEAPDSAPEEHPLVNLPQWDDPETDSKQLTSFQRREIRKVLARVKKTKHGAHFRDSVQKLWPVLWDSYIAKIEKPTDLSEIDRTLRDPNGTYVTLGDFRKDLSLMYENTRIFNGSVHYITYAAVGAIRSIWEDVLPIPAEEPTKPKAAPKAKPPRESRTSNNVDTTARTPSAGPATSPAADEPVAKSHSSAYEQTSDQRGASTATDGDRPKRTVRAPKPKDIDYSTKPSRKKLKPELQFCEEVLTELMHPKNKHMNVWFLDPVDAEGLKVPQYYSIIKKPMDLGQVSRMLSGGEIANVKEFDKNIKLIFNNCYTFNGTPDQGNPVAVIAKQLEDHYNSQMKNKDAWLAKHAKANAPPATSNASDEEDEDEEDIKGEAATVTVPDPLTGVRDLEMKLREESEKLTDLFAADSPNQHMIQVQQGILKMVQKALLEAKQKLAEYRQKHDKTGKKAGKPGKPSKPKSSGSSGARKSSGASQPKKSGPKKAAPKKTLTAADKDQIANAINDLEYPHLDRAIDIIKRDTGQAENNDGELELDIDQLSNEALLKLWELCKKVLTGFGKDSAPAPASSPELTRAVPPKKAAPTASKPKKNKPMSAREQEERIAQLRGLRDLYKPGQDPSESQVTQAPTPTAETSEDSDSEEE